MNKEIKLWGEIIDDNYIMDELKKYPPHLTLFKITEERFEKIIFERLEKLGIKIDNCKGCGRKILFLKTKSGKIMPTCLDLTSHFKDCPDAKKFRNKKNEIKKRNSN